MESHDPKQLRDELIELHSKQLDILEKEIFGGLTTTEWREYEDKARPHSATVRRTLHPEDRRMELASSGSLHAFSVPASLPPHFHFRSTRSTRGDAGPNTIRPPFGDRRPSSLQGGFKQAYCLAGTIDLLTNWPGISCRRQKIIPALRFKRRWRVSSLTWTYRLWPSHCCAPSSEQEEQS